METDHQYVTIRQAVERMRMMDTVAPHDDDNGVAATTWTTAATTPRGSSSSTDRTTAAFTRGLGTVNVVAIVTDVSVPQQLPHHDRATTSAATTAIKRKYIASSSSSGRGNRRRRLRRPRHCLWIVDRSVVPEIEEENVEEEAKKQREELDYPSTSHQQHGRADVVRRHHQAVVTVASASASLLSGWEDGNSRLRQPREGDVVALHGLKLSKACAERLLFVGAAKEGSATNLTGFHPPYEFVFDAAASYALATANPRTSYPPRIQVLAHVDKWTRSVTRYDDLLDEDRRRHDGAAAVDPTLSSAAAHRTVSELVDWYLHSCCDGTTIRGGNWTDDPQQWVQQRSVSELLSLSTPSRSGTAAARRPVLSHVVARVSGIQEHHPVEGGHERSRGVVRSLPPPATTTVILLSDATSELPIPLVMHSHLHGKLRQRFADLMKSHEASLSSPWIRLTRLELVRLQDAWGDAVAPDHDHNAAIALIPTTHTTFNAIPHDELIGTEGWRSQPSQHPDRQELESTSQLSRIRRSTRTIEATIASICIANAEAKSTIVLNASNVHELVSRVLPLLRRHDEGRDDDDVRVDVSIALEDCRDESSASSPMDLPRTRIPADWHVIRSLLWGGARPDAVRSGDLDEIATRLVCGMLTESIRFTWIFMECHATAATATANKEADAPYRIVDVSLRQL